MRRSVLELLRAVPIAHVHAARGEAPKEVADHVLMLARARALVFDQSGASRRRRPVEPDEPARRIDLHCPSPCDCCYCWTDLDPRIALPARRDQDFHRSRKRFGMLGTRVRTRSAPRIRGVTRRGVPRDRYHSAAQPLRGRVIPHAPRPRPTPAPSAPTFGLCPNLWTFRIVGGTVLRQLPTALGITGCVRCGVTQGQQP